ncbi:MAG TPA: glycosyltransferase family 4 protein [Burkholderiaceae bacterium]|nr:glycosyltransferase family 4 protein [Burkholderiaceae bacterium]
MKMLYLTFNAIDDRSYGAALRSAHIRDAMTQIGQVHTLIIHAGARMQIDADWDESGVKRATYNRIGLSVGARRQRAEIRAWVGDVLRQGRYDAIVARYLGMARFVPRWAWPRMVLDADDLVKSVAPDDRVPLRTRLALWARNLVARRVAERAAHVWCVNPLDAARLGTTRVSLLRNVVRIPPANRPRADAVPGRLLMVGLFEYAPNAQALRWFAQAVLPALRAEIPGVELHAVGKCPPALQAELAGQGLHCRGFVTDLAREYDLASLVIAPVQSGGGTQIKVIDALAHQRPLAISAFAHAGFAADLKHPDHLLRCTTAQDWISHCRWALRERAAAEAMADRGYAAVRAYGSDTLTPAIQATLQAVSRQSP